MDRMHEVDTATVGDEVAQAFVETASPVLFRSGLLLSISISILPEDLAYLTRELWPDEIGSAEAVEAVEVLGEWPFVLKGNDGWTMLESVAVVLSKRFRTTDPDKFRLANQALADLESHNESSGDLDQGWFIRGRIAFYLAGIRPHDAADEFGEAFEHPPIMERTACRIWLSDLVLRQAPLLDQAGQERAVLFFRGFRYYVSGNRGLAASYFDQVLKEREPRDLYRAISLHLRALCRVKDDTNESVASMLKESIELSRRLKLDANEIMARHSLTWLRVREAGAVGDAESGPLLREAQSLAEANLKRSARLEDKGLLLWCTMTAAMVQWLLYVGADHRRRPDIEARLKSPVILGQLSEALALADSLDDAETALTILNHRAELYRDLNDFEAAVEELEEATRRATLMYQPYQVIRNILQTAGSLRRITSGREQENRLSQVINKLDALVGSR